MGATVDRKRTAWKKSRTFGDVYGGRTSRKVPDRIRWRAHSLRPPTQHDDLPIFMVDNPSRDFFFPLTCTEIQKELRHLPKKHWKTVTHVWLRRFRKTDYADGILPFAEFICGSGVRAIVLYPWPKDLRLYLGPRRPAERVLRPYAKYAPVLRQHADGWYLAWSLASLKDFYVEYLLYHEIGHNLDWYDRKWTAANRRSAEAFADQYAFERTAKRSIRYRLQ